MKKYKKILQKKVKNICKFNQKNIEIFKNHQKEAMLLLQNL
jgi:hypothetical protein